MNNIIKFESVENGKELFLFELDGKIATIAPELMAFEGYGAASKAWFDIKEREDFEDGYEYKTLQGEELKLFKQVLKESKDLSLITSEVKTLYDQYKSAPRLDIVFEEGIRTIIENNQNSVFNMEIENFKNKVRMKRKEIETFPIIISSLSGIVDIKMQYSILSYNIDLYIPSLNLAIECDEYAHKTYSFEQQEKREEKIRNVLNCEFIRYNPHDEFFNIGDVINKIFKAVLLNKNEHEKRKLIDNVKEKEKITNSIIIYESILINNPDDIYAKMALKSLKNKIKNYK
ncbi:hypothetical protein [Metabacillus fastidiosus]|uniref:hypothetical protein n=1 Tax=Metabacillus fastidiosus TaxID=1458 RepID=UPI003D2BCBC5